VPYKYGRQILFISKPYTTSNDIGQTIIFNDIYDPDDLTKTNYSTPMFVDFLDKNIELLKGKQVVLNLIIPTSESDRQELWNAIYNKIPYNKHSPIYFGIAIYSVFGKSFESR
jgi:hypothetical protein